MVGVIKVVLEERKRTNDGRADAAIPMRPDHGHQMLDDIASA
jgi:mannonate dehydratase